MTNTETKALRTRTYVTLVAARATADVGAVRYTLTDTITELATGGIRVDTHARGMAEGARVDQRSSSTYPAVTLEAAEAYRLTHGYSKVTR